MKKIKTIKAIKILGILTLAVSLIGPSVLADGWHPSAEFLHLYEPAQKAVIHWDGTTEIMVLSSAARSESLTNIAWVVPIISTTKPNVTSGNMSVFEELVDFFGAYYWWDSPFRSVHMEYDNGNNVTVVETSEIGIYDVIIVKATNASDLIDWLIENNLIVPEEAYDVINRYVNKENCYFIINKIDLKNRFKDVIEQLENGTYHENYSEYQKVLSDLKIGMATPLMFKFTPPEPYYPLVISSLNAGEGKIEVYVIAEKPVADANGVMVVDRIKNMTSKLKEKLEKIFPIGNEEYITRLSYNGLLEDLTDDAVFDFFTPSSRYDPLFFYIPSNLENLTATSFIDIMVFDQDGGLIELQYRIDGAGAWMVAERTDMAYVYEKWWYFFDYNMHIPKTDGALWTIDLEGANLAEGNHTLEIRVLRSNRHNSLYYTPVHSCNFILLGDTVESGILKSESSNLNAALMSCLVTISIFSVAVVSRKTKL